MLTKIGRKQYKTKRKSMKTSKSKEEKGNPKTNRHAEIEREGEKKTN